MEGGTNKPLRDYPQAWQHYKYSALNSLFSQFSVYSFKESIDKSKIFPSLHFLLVFDAS